VVIGFVSGYSAKNSVKTQFFYSLSFALGTAITFTILGLIASIAGSLLGDIGPYWKYILAAVAFIMGLQLLGLFTIKLPTPQIKNYGIKGYLGALIVGILFGLSASPCATPILVVILTLVASQGNLFYGTILLLSYAIGNAFLIMILGTSTGFFKKLLSSEKSQKFSEVLIKISGAILVFAGIYILITGH